MNILKVVVSFLLILFPYRNTFPGFPPTTLIATPQGSVPIEYLVSGALVHSSEHAATVAANMQYTSNECTLIKTAQHIIISSPDQRFFESISQTFCEAQCLIPGDMLISRDGQKFPVVHVENYAHPIDYHDFSLSGPHTFFAGSGEYVVHNVAPVVIAAGVWESLKALIGGGAVLAAIYLRAPPKILGSYENARPTIERDMQAFLGPYFTSGGHKNYAHPKLRRSYNLSAVPNFIADIVVAPHAYLDRLNCPNKYGQLYAAAKMTPHGTVDCVLFAEHFYGWNP